MQPQFKEYTIVTAAYWAFTLTDGALRMLVLFHFHQLGYGALAVASLFIFYEVFGVITNLFGGWLGARFGLNRTLHAGLVLQVLALGMMVVPSAWLSVPYVMLAQAGSGIAKDLTKMSAKSSIKMLVAHDAQSTLFKWVAILTGSKNALKGVGFFLGSLLLSTIGFRSAFVALASLIAIATLGTWLGLQHDLGRSKAKPKWQQMFAKSRAINLLSAARCFLFAARDVWFVVGLPVFLSEVLGWSFWQVGGYLALWVIGYGLIQALAPQITRRWQATPNGSAATIFAALLMLIMASLASVVQINQQSAMVVVVGLIGFGVIFALNSAVHSYLILAYTDQADVALNVGFYYMANALGRLLGTILSGLLYQRYGLVGCLWAAACLSAITALISLSLPRVPNQLTSGDQQAKAGSL
ncbi:organoarsenical effux MFS transporter ArsJ [Herpetosiphon llansteffanensis]|uniref:organoarsenical effux MFS transporter ArsJ n=1 Tax=Herpetosiphon llansteffanensis TaxID=2094568 RepID=UPI000D7BB611|nr:organoarsenical effux MFS transporter ArsJ [Herpetosiphon llansteffanensis]